MRYKIGDIVRGRVTGIQPYGVFVALDDDTQGLIHISELKHGYVEKVDSCVSMNEEIDVMILDIDEYSKKISLSLRGLQEAEYHPFSNRFKISRYGKKTGKGFGSIEQKMPQWIEEARANFKD